MYKLIFLHFLMYIFSTGCFSQTDYSDLWEDFYSYNNIRDFTVVNERIYAAADNAVFIYDEANKSTRKFSSVKGLSGKQTSSIYYSENAKSFVVGYESGLIEIIDDKGNIEIANDIERLEISGQKQINHISEDKEYIYLSTPFGIVQYNLEKRRFGDTYYIGNGSTAVFVNQTAIFGNQIFAATRNGIYSAEINNPALVDFNNWIQPSGDSVGDFKAITVFKDKLYISRENVLFEIVGINLITIGSFESTIIDLKSSADYLTLSQVKKALVFDNNLQIVAQETNTSQFAFDLNTAAAQGNKIYLGTSQYGILKKDTGTQIYEEIHPEGPLSNEVFSITAGNKQLWVVYGGYDPAFTPLNKRAGYSHFNGEEKRWINTDFNSSFPALDLVHITFDPNHENKVYISSWNSGILVVENDQPLILLNDTNSGLEDLYPPGNPNTSIRINGTAFDPQNNFWVANAWVDNRLKKLSSGGTWSSFNLSSIMTNESYGLTELVLDRSNSVWIGSRRNGALVYQENGDKKKALTTEATKGSLPDANVKSLVVDRNNRVWIGTLKGLVVYYDPGNLFNETIYDAEPVVIVDDGIPKKLLGDQPVNTIAIDGADNKWFGTDTGGAINTNGSGQKTLHIFNKDNSPLPSNRILKISIDNLTGKVYFATDKGIVAFNNNIAPYGDSLTSVYAFPNPVKKEHNIVTIDGRNGSHLPRGTNVKILDTSGKLVFETNVQENQEAFGGKVVWNKRNLAGHPVSSGIYLVLLTLPDTSESAITKIAIIN